MTRARRLPLALVAAAAGAAALLSGCGPEDRTAPGLYADYCARCHGKDGKGDRRSINLYPNLDLTASQLARHHLRGPIYRRIAEGYGPMPAFSHRLEHHEIESLVDLMLSFQAPARAPTQAPTQESSGRRR